MDRGQIATVEVTVRGLTADGGKPRDPAGSTCEIEDYDVNLQSVSALELVVERTSKTTE